MYTEKMLLFINLKTKTKLKCDPVEISLKSEDQCLVFLLISNLKEGHTRPSTLFILLILCSFHIFHWFSEKCCLLFELLNEINQLVKKELIFPYFPF